MKLPEYDYQVRQLSREFYEKYNSPSYPEILKKNKRPYNCLLFQTHYDYYICIPYRTNITHSYAYRFKKSKRSRNYQSGLDYTKIVIIKNSNYIDEHLPIIDKDEYNETIQHITKIQCTALRYIEGYMDHIKGTNQLSYQEFNRRYNYSTVKYFHNELGI